MLILKYEPKRDWRNENCFRVHTEPNSSILNRLSIVIYLAKKDICMFVVTLVFRLRTDYEKRVRAQARAMTVPE